MRLPIPFLKNKEIESKYYLALSLEDNKIYSVVLQEDKGIAKIVGKHKEILNTPLEELSQIELIEYIDKTISKAEEVLPPDIETHKTVFGVKDSWVDQESKKIKKDHLNKLKKVCDSLDLTPIGFMVVTEAVSNLIQKEEGAPLSAILVDLDKTKASISLFRGGQIIEATSGQISDSAVKTVDSLLKNFTASVLPARIILHNSKSTDGIHQQFITHEWSKDLPFLHVPQIKVLPDNFVALSIAFGAVQQMGFDIQGIPDLANEQTENKPLSEKSEKQDEPDGEDLSAGDNFGFVQNQDIAKVAPKPHHQESIPQAPTPDKKPLHENFNEIIPNPNLEDATVNNKPEIKNNETNYLASLSGIISSIKLSKLPKLPASISKNKGLILPGIILGVVIILILGIWLYYYYGTKAQVILSVKPKDVTQETNITFSAKEPTDFSKKIIAGKSISTVIEGDLSTPTTGKKDTGNKAKGNITVYNSSTSEQSISSGTQIKSEKGIIFTLDKDITIASASGDVFSGTKPGTTDASVTAKDLGTEGNLPSGTKFTIGGNTTLAAKNDSAFSGGTKKTITVVSKEDLAKLKTDLPKTLESKALDELSNNKENAETILPDFIDVAIDKSKFDKAIDDEAKEVKITGSVKFEALSYSNSDLENFDKSILKDNYSTDIAFADESIKNEVSNTKIDKNNNINGKLKITAGLLPKIESTEVKNKIKNESSSNAKKMLSNLPQVEKVDIKYSPSLLFLSSVFPKLPKNIELTIKSND